MPLWNRPRSGKSGPTPPADGQSPQFGPVAQFYDELMNRIPYEAWVSYVESLIRTHQIRGTEVLDLACGTGRVGSEMLRRGYRVRGLDISEPMVRHCARRDPPLPAAVMDACQLGLSPECLDIVVCLYDSLNYILDPEGLQRCFDRLHAALRPGGGLIFDLNTPRALKTELFTQSNMDSRALLQYDWRAHWEEESQTCRVEMLFRWRGEGGPLEFRETHRQRSYPDSQIQEMLARAGFGPVTSYDGYSFRPLDYWTDRVFYVACK